MSKTPLHAQHVAAGARMVDFAGFSMPLQYSGITDEHNTVRQAVGLFDVSHMGEVRFRGAGAADAVHRLVTNDVAGLADGAAMYSPICKPDGGIVDDCMIYRTSADNVLVVVNAANVVKDFAWLRDNTAGDSTVTVSDESDRWALLALQGPRAEATLRALSPDAAGIAAFTHIEADVAGGACLVARTGYTGEDGFEIYCAADHAPALWSALLEAGAEHGIKPCGLGARDTLRLEAKLMLYGNDIDESTTPLEAGLGWTVKLKAGDFIGREALQAQKKSGVERKLVGLVMRSRGIARPGYNVCALAGDGGAAAGSEQLGEVIGRVTSGTKSPTLGEAIALAYVPKAHSKPGARLAVDVRGKAVIAEVVKGPFYKRSE
ncbi:MAG: glycine cleavage system aminomethyltransferase GcvT [Myxococcales bacterium]|nr:glycine cleavage system aminomethyltransferase GcvT [Myxococcales bacterium]